MTQVDTVKFAVRGAEFGSTDTWHCPCGASHKFGAYVAAHWKETLAHRCACGVVRDFRSGRVKKVINVNGLSK